MRSPLPILHLDFETASTVDLKKAGATKYAASPETVVLLVAWAFDNGPIELHIGDSLPPAVRQHLESGGEFRAWNAAFEWAILVEHFKLRLDARQAVCVMQKAAFSGYPMSLDMAGDAIGLPFGKDQDGHRLMMRMCKPRKDGSWWHKVDPLLLLRLGKYCQLDVSTERDLDGLIRDLPPLEARVSQVDRLANNRGVRLDVPMIHQLRDLALHTTQAHNDVCATITGGAVTSPGTQSAKLISWLKTEGVFMVSVDKESVSAMLEKPLPLDARNVLEIRKAVARSSVKKLDSMLACLMQDGRARGMLQYYGASRTGRFAGRLIQLQNMPRPLRGLDVKRAITSIVDGMDAEGLATFFGEPLAVIASCLRGCLVPEEGNVFLVFDLAQIESRMICWLAGQQDVLDLYEKGEDVYLYAAAQQNSLNRDFGKVLTLALGFQMGAARLVETAANYGIKLTLLEAEAAVSLWRGYNDYIVEFWWACDRAVRNAIFQASSISGQFPSFTVPIGDGKCSATVSKARNGHVLLTINLPSGRALYYRHARLLPDAAGMGRVEIVYRGINQYTKKWEDIRTYAGKIAENITQACARDVMCEAIIRVEDLGLMTEFLLSVHDEGLWEIEAQSAHWVAPVVKREIEKRPSWAPGLPVSCGKGDGITERYGK